MTVNSHPHRFDPARKELLEKAEYRRLNAGKVLDSLPLKPADRVADIGAGTGFFTIPLAQRLAEGKVLAMDISPEMLAFLKDKIVEAQITNVEAMLCKEASFPVARWSLDGVVIFLVLHEAEDRPAFLKAAKAVLKQGGWVGLLEWKAKNFSAKAPGPPLESRIPMEEARLMAMEAGFKVVSERTEGPYYYLLILEA